MAEMTPDLTPAEKAVALLTIRHYMMTGSDRDENDHRFEYEFCAECGEEVDWPCSTYLVLDQLDAQRERAERYREALVEIRESTGTVCAEYEVCQHPQCDASCFAYLRSIAALNEARAARSGEGEG